MGQYFCVNAPSKAPLRPEGGVVGEYIDRCIIVLLAVIDKYHKEAAVGGAIQLYKIFEGAQSPFIPTLVLAVALLYMAVMYVRRVLGLKTYTVFL